MKISKLFQKFSVAIICLTMISLAPSKDRTRDVEIDVEVDGNKIIRESRDVRTYESNGPGREKRAGHTEYRAGLRMRSQDTETAEVNAQHLAIIKLIHALEIQEMELKIKKKEIQVFIENASNENQKKDLKAEIAEISIEMKRLKNEQQRQMQRVEEIQLLKQGVSPKHIMIIRKINALKNKEKELLIKADEIFRLTWDDNGKEQDKSLLKEKAKISLEVERIQIEKRRLEQQYEQQELIESEDEIRDFAVVKSKIQARSMKGDAFGVMEDEEHDVFRGGDAFGIKDNFEFDKNDLKTLKKDSPNLVKLYEMMMEEIEGVDEEDGEELFEEMFDMKEGMANLLMLKKEYPAMYQLESKSADLEAQSEILSHEINLAKEKKKGSEKPLITKLRKLLNEEFEAREELRKFEAEEISRELNEIQNLLKKRRENKDRIIEFRILELTQERDEMLEW